MPSLIDAAGISKAVQELREESERDGFLNDDLPIEPLAELRDALADAHGLQPLLDALKPHRGDRNIAELLYSLCDRFGHDLTSIFCEDEIAAAAVERLAPFAGDRVDIRGKPRWGWDALFHHDYGARQTSTCLTDDAHFRIVQSVIERVPWDDGIFWRIGDGPLSQTGADPVYLTKIEAAAKSDARMKRIDEIMEQDWRQQQESLRLLAQGRDPE